MTTLHSRGEDNDTSQSNCKLKAPPLDNTLTTNHPRIVTLDPFIGPRSEHDLTEERRKRTGRRIKEQKIKRLLPLQDLFVDDQKFPLYYVLNFPDIDSRLNVIAADSEIKLKIGKSKKIVN